MRSQKKTGEPRKPGANGGGDPDKLTPDQQKLVEAYLPLMGSIAREYRRRGLRWKELASAGTVGLMGAAALFDPAKGNFATFARRWIQWAIQQEFDKEKLQQRIKAEAWASTHGTTHARASGVRVVERRAQSRSGQPPKPDLSPFPEHRPPALDIYDGLVYEEMFSELFGVKPFAGCGVKELDPDELWEKLRQFCDERGLDLGYIWDRLEDMIPSLKKQNRRTLRSPKQEFSISKGKTLTTTEAAQKLGESPDTVARRCEDGCWGAYRHGRRSRWHIPEDQIEAEISRRDEVHRAMRPIRRKRGQPNTP